MVVLLDAASGVRLPLAVIVPMLIGEAAAVAMSFAVFICTSVAVPVCFSMVAMRAEFLGAVALAGAEENQDGGG